MVRYTAGSRGLGSVLGRLGHPMLVWLIGLNVGVYVLGWLLWGVGRGLGVPAEEVLYRLLAVPADVGLLLGSPWTLVSYMFFHRDLLHILFNMLWLLAFGQIFLSAQPAYRLRNLYVLGGLLGGLVYVLAYNAVPYFWGVLPFARALGASAAVMAITVCAALHRPNMQVLVYGLFPVRVKWIALVAIGIDVLSVSGQNAGGHIAHLGGALMGWLYARSLSSGAYFDLPFSWVGGLWSGLRDRLRRVSGGGGKGRGAVSERRMDAILRKLSRGGYGSLSREEKELLFRRRE